MAGLAAAERLTLRHLAIAGDAAQTRHDEGERAHVGRLFLHPDDFARGGMGFDGGLQLGFGPGIELIEEDDAGGRVLALRALDAQLVADFAGGDEQALGVLDFRFRQDGEEARTREVCDGAKARRDGAACSWA